MPIQLPYKSISAAGAYNLDSHVQLVDVAYAGVGHVDLYLPPDPVPYSELTIVAHEMANTNKILKLITHGSHTIDGKSRFWIANGDETVVLLPDSDGNWSVLQAPNAEYVALVGAATGAATDTWVEAALVAVGFDCSNIASPTQARVTIPKTGRYEVTLGLEASLTTGKIAQARAVNAGGSTYYGYCLGVDDGASAKALNAVPVAYLTAGTVIAFEARHNEGAPATVVVLGSVRRVT